MCLRESVKSVCRNNRHITQSCLQQLLHASTFSLFRCSSTVNCLAWARPRAAMATASFIALLRARRGGQPDVHPAQRCAPHQHAAFCPETITGLKVAFAGALRAVGGVCGAARRRARAFPGLHGPRRTLWRGGAAADRGETHLVRATGNLFERCKAAAKLAASL